MNQEELRDKAAHLFVALKAGRVWTNGGGVLDYDGKFLMTTTEMREVVQYLHNIGISVNRIDSGGQPTWRLETEI
jgi:hypothetical protein